MGLTFQTNLDLGVDGNTSLADTDGFRNILFSISGGAIDVDPLTYNGPASGPLLADVKANTIPLALVSATLSHAGSLADHLTFTHEFGMELPEFISWWYEGGGQALFQSQIDALAPPDDQVLVYPLVLRAAESGGWFKEALTLKKMREGKYSDGSQMAFRAFGTHAGAMAIAFPQITTPSPTTGVLELAEVFSGKYNGGEFSEPYGDASPTTPANGLFPNWPASASGSIISALGGRPHYYVGSYHTPFRHRVMLVNKTWHATLTAAQQDMFEAAVRYNVVRNVAHSFQGGDAIIKQFQDFGAVIHRELPRDIQDRFRTAIGDRQETIAAGDADYAAILTSQRTFMKANAVRWASLPDRRYRVARTDYETDLTPDA